ncbi:FAD dependent oxidoreductase [Coriobacterium glomerans PW2]|uniref:FAD dependent oxidoreductase n=1 Tax=Coriobacterium glomerans (strain ATCC 49209 / DSM 20642 / JCM 10262 / PW2) TaxID=700015 RepID=F2N8Q8_CORGP|nr:NAD(P)/FAD-dependent oxidoreductase [Coriobacterium glomerans]AEB07441.1 FAD dependent oxidoreductase [Coriobacterium glomerans PW2]
MERFDAVVIGAGVIGCAIARELSRFRLDACVIEKEPDVAFGNSSRNTGMLHAGFTYAPGSLKAICAVEGNREFDHVASELDVAFRRSGKVVVGFTDRDRANILKFMDIGMKNGVEGLKMVDKQQLHDIEPQARGEFALYSPMSGILDPIQYTIALAENAHANGVRFLFRTKVTGLNWCAQTDEGFYRVITNRGVIQSRWIINCAGMYSTDISEMLGITGHVTKGFKGEYYVLDKRAAEGLRTPVYPAPNEKGGFSTHATITVDGNVLVGPDSYITEGREDYATSSAHLAGLVRDGKKMFDNVKQEFFIRTFAGIRWKRVDPITGKVLDFVVERRDEAPQAVNLVGIESPGVTSALPLARRAIDKMREVEDLEEDPAFSPERAGIKRFCDATLAQQRLLVEQDRAYGEIICRCEMVTRAEILAAIHNPLGAHTLASVKNRTRATMGRCQAGYCESRITALIRSELDADARDVCYQHEGSHMFTGDVRGGVR